MKSKFYLILIISIVGCQQKKEITEGWEYNNPNNGGFKKVRWVDQETLPNMIFVGKGFYYTDFSTKTDTNLVSSFFISKYEETNLQYLAYLDFLKRYYSKVTYHNALPDTAIWMTTQLEAATKKFMLTNYLRGSEFKHFPVVGLTPIQIKRYARWKSDRINEYILIREGVISDNWDINDSSEVFTVNGYLDSQPEPINMKDIRDIRSRPVKMEDGILVPPYRLASIDEWQMAHLAIGNDKNQYPKTAKASKIRGANNRFYYLQELDTKTKSTNALETVDGLNTVFNQITNNYKLFGLNSNVSEVVKDELGYHLIGGSFLSSIPDNHAIYNKHSIDTLKYEVPHKVHKTTSIDSTNTGLFGFRLAMDWIDQLSSPDF